MTGKARILGIQITPEIGNKEANLKKAQDLIDKNADFNPDLIVLPEVFNSSVCHKYFHPLAESIPNGPTTELFLHLAAKYKTNIVVGSFIEKCPDEKYRNASIVLDRSGNIIGKYHKIHMFSYYGSNEGEFISVGNSAVVIETDTGKIGLSICYDLRFPELYRALAYAGAEIIVCPAAWPHPRLEHWLTLNKARAIENQVYMVSVNQVGEVKDGRINLGHSMIINPWGEIISSAGEKEGVIKAEIDLNEQKRLREEFPVLNDRNLDAYKVLNIKAKL